MAQGDENRVGFRTDGEWTLGDLEEFAAAIRQTYNCFLSVYLWKAELARPVFRIMLPSPWARPLESKLEEIIMHPELHASVQQRIRVRSIAMASPGGIDLLGLGPVIKQFRELIKDLWYRNSQERRKGQIDIMREALRLERERVEFELEFEFPKQERILIEKAEEGIDHVRRLEAQGRLVDIADNLDFEPTLVMKRPPRQR